MTVDFMQVNFRMPLSLKRKLEEEAKISGRTTTSEIVHRLTAYEDMAEEVQRLREQTYQNEIIIKRLTGMVQSRPAENPEVSQIMDVVNKQQAMIEDLMSALREQGKLIDRLTPAGKE